MNNDKKHFCPLPWIGLSSRSNGDLRVCCQANASISRGICVDEKSQPYNISKSDFLKFRNSPLLKSVRRSFLEGKWHSVCERCRTEEENGIRSRREYSSRLHQHNINIEKALSKTDSDGTLNTEGVPLIDFDIRFGNLCNLKCRMCFPTDSSSWYDDYYELFGDTFSDGSKVVKLERSDEGVVYEPTKQYQWHEGDGWLINIDKSLNTAQRIYLVGGEPLLIKKHNDFLNLLIEKGISKNLILEYNTNLTHLNQTTIKLWTQFKDVRLGVSIDGDRVMNEYIRFPSNFIKISENIKFVDQTADNIRFWFALTISPYNFSFWPRLISWIQESNFKKIDFGSAKVPIKHHFVFTPKWLNIRNLNSNFKDALKSNLRDCYQQESKKWSPQVHILSEKILNDCLLYLKGNSEKDFTEDFVSKTKKLDTLRKQDINTIAADLGQLIQSY
jgi:sulfatase maturation enzyme AslB (radical SAM superfamily)